MTPLTFASLFPDFQAPSWQRWRDVLAHLTPDVRELFIAAGRGGGKSRFSSLLAAWACCRTYQRAPGEEVYVGVFGPDRRQAHVTFRYIAGLLKTRPELARLILVEQRERLELHGGVVVEVMTASTAAPRGRSYALAIVEEAAFLPNDDTSADPDVELLRALRPALARVPGSLLAVISSPYAKRGVLWSAVEAGSTAARLVITGDTASFNPTFRQAEIARAFAADPVSASSEYGKDGTISFRPDVSGLLSPEALAAVIPAGVRERAPGPRAVAHFDAATGSGSDAAALGMAFSGQPARLAVCRQWRPPFSPSAVIAEAASVCRAYGVTTITIDRFAPGFVADGFRAHGVACRVAEKDTSAHFVELLGLINSQRVALLDVPALRAELGQLERRPGSGRDHVGHPSRGHDDVAAAAAGALVAAIASQQNVLDGRLTWDTDDAPRRPDPTTTPWGHPDPLVARQRLARYLRTVGNP